MNLKAESREYYLAGFFEAGGSMNFRIITNHRKNRIRISSHPEISYTDNSYERMHCLQDVFGGGLYPVRGGSEYRWMLFGSKVYPLIANCETYNPSREQVIRAYKEWESADMQTRLTIAKRFIGSGRNFEGLSYENYLDLVEHPQFMAGILDSRGRFALEKITSGRDLEHLQLRTYIHSINRPLLEAINKRYKSSLFSVLDEGEKRLVNGTEIIIKHESVKLAMGPRVSLSLLAEIAPYLILRKAEAEEILC